jgi:uncharacterized protein with PQ loop repeat
MRVCSKFHIQNLNSEKERKISKISLFSLSIYCIFFFPSKHTWSSFCGILDVSTSSVDLFCFFGISSTYKTSFRAMWDIVLPPPQTPKCYTHPKNVIAIILGMAIVFGQFIAFAPQLYSIIRKKHVEGINLLTYLLGTVSCTAVFYSGLLESWQNLFCCKVIVSVPFYAFLILNLVIDPF